MNMKKYGKTTKVGQKSRALERIRVTRPRWRQFDTPEAIPALLTFRSRYVIETESLP